MKVSDLIKILQKLPQNYKVEHTDSDGDVVPLEERDIVNMDVFGKGHPSIHVG